MHAQDELLVDYGERWMDDVMKSHEVQRQKEEENDRITSMILHQQLWKSILEVSNTWNNLKESVRKLDVANPNKTDDYVKIIIHILIYIYNI